MAVLAVKGTAFTLAQVNGIAPVGDTTKEAYQVEAGDVVALDANGKIVKYGAKEGENDLAATPPLGIAINNWNDNDVVGSGKIGYYMWDGNSVIATDKFIGDTGSYTVGAVVVALTGNNAGKVGIASANGQQAIGYVAQVKELKGYGAEPYKITTMVAIKLYSHPEATTGFAE